MSYLSWQIRLWQLFLGTAIAGIGCLALSVLLPYGAVGTCMDLPAEEREVLWAMQQLSGARVCEQFT